MRTILLLICIAITSCNAETEYTSDNNPDLQTQEQADTTEVYPMPENTSIDLVTGQFNFQNHDDFVKVDDKYTTREIYLQAPANEAFKAMAERAKEDGVELVIISGTRNFWYQKAIWDRKWQESGESTDLAKARDILLYSAMPMTSRHHWGTDLDLNSLNNSWFEEGEGKQVYEWLQTHANHFGFYQPYTEKSMHGRTGYEEEKWHWSYMPLAGLYLDFYNEHVANEDITGFDGSELAPQIDMVGNYVNGVSIEVKDF